MYELSPNGCRRTSSGPFTACTIPAPIGTDLRTDLLDSMTTVEPMTAVPDLAERILAGQTRGRVVIDTAR